MILWIHSHNSLRQTVKSFQLTLKKTRMSTKRFMKSISRLSIRSLRLNLNSNTITLMKILTNFINRWRIIIKHIKKKIQMLLKFYMGSLIFKSLKKKSFHSERQGFAQLIPILMLRIIKYFKMICLLILLINQKHIRIL